MIRLRFWRWLAATATARMDRAMVKSQRSPGYQAGLSRWQQDWNRRHGK